MRRTVSRCLRAQSPVAVVPESALRCMSLRGPRPFSTSPRATEGDRSTPNSFASLAQKNPSSPAPGSHEPPPQNPVSSSTMGALSRLMETNHRDRQARQDRKPNFGIDEASPDDYLIDYDREKNEEPHHFHIYATKQNTHITVTRPDRSPMISKSAGDLGFKKSSRKSYDAAFQLASYVTGKLQESGKMREISKVEIVLRGFGQGREAVTKALLGSEGRFLRKKIVKVSDATRLKFGGTRSPKPRRLG